MPELTPTPDLAVSFGGLNFVLVQPLTATGRTWIDGSAEPGALRWVNHSLVVENRYLQHLLDGAQADGLTIDTED